MRLKDLETGGKALLRATLVKLLPAPRRHDAPADPASVRRVLAVRHDARLGNLLLLTPALRLIKQAFPNASVDVLIADAYGEALAHNPHVARLLTAAGLPALRFSGYDLAFDFAPQHAFSLSSAVWTALSGAPRRVGFDRGDEVRFCDLLVPVPTDGGHETANLAALVRAAAPKAALPPDASLRTEWFFAPGEREEGKRLWDSWGLDGRSVALFLGARAEKRLDPSWFMELGERLNASGRKAALFGGPAERKFMEGLRLPPGLVLAPPLPLRRFASAIAAAAAVVSADTGPMHLSIAVGTPTLQLFSHTEPWRFGYRDSRHVLLETPGRHASVEEAWAALSDLLSRR
jgi:heptosyltransferase-3